MRYARAAAAASAIRQATMTHAHSAFTPHVACTVHAISVADAPSSGFHPLNKLYLTFDIDADQLLGTSGASPSTRHGSSSGSRQTSSRRSRPRDHNAEFNATAAPLFVHGGVRPESPTGHPIVTKAGVSGSFRIGGVA